MAEGRDVIEIRRGLVYAFMWMAQANLILSDIESKAGVNLVIIWMRTTKEVQGHDVDSVNVKPPCSSFVLKTVWCCHKSAMIWRQKNNQKWIKKPHIRATYIAACSLLELYFEDSSCNATEAPKAKIRMLKAFHVAVPW